MNLIGQRFIFDGQPATVLRILGRWSSTRLGLEGFIVTVYLHRDERVERHVRVVERAGGVEVVDVDERVVFRGVA